MKQHQCSFVRLKKDLNATLEESLFFPNCTKHLLSFLGYITETSEQIKMHKPNLGYEQTLLSLSSYEKRNIV